MQVVFKEDSPYLQQTTLILFYVWFAGMTFVLSILLCGITEAGETIDDIFKHVDISDPDASAFTDIRIDVPNLFLCTHECLVSPDCYQLAYIPTTAQCLLSLCNKDVILRKSAQ